jgi:hypothetical protein
MNAVRECAFMRGRTATHMPSPNTDPLGHRHTPSPNTDPLGNRHTPSPNTDPLGHRHMPDPRSAQASPPAYVIRQQTLSPRQPHSLPTVRDSPCLCQRYAIRPALANGTRSAQPLPTVRDPPFLPLPTAKTREQRTHNPIFSAKGVGPPLLQS